MSELHPNQLALIEWGKRHPYSVLEIKFQDGIPISALAPTEDGLGKANILFTKLVKEYGISTEKEKK